MLKQSMESFPLPTTTGDSDTPYPILRTSAELRRLDDLHESFSRFMGNTIAFAPIGNPRRILDLGCGTGAWAIQAALQFPESFVTATDIADLPQRPLPSNFEFKKVNIIKPLDGVLELASFDVVHIRLVLCHLPNFEANVRRIASLVAPGGWLLIDDIEHNVYAKPSISPPAPNVDRFYDLYHRYFEPLGVEWRAGSRSRPLLLSQGFQRDFDKAQVFGKKVTIPMSQKADYDPVLKDLGRAARLSYTRAYRKLDEKLQAFGLTREVQRAFEAELNDPTKDLYTDYYFTWARKKE